MTLEKNLIDNITECIVKLGSIDVSMTFYYPLSSLLELLDTDEDSLSDAIENFTLRVKDTLGDVVISKVKGEKGRYGITVPVNGIKWVDENYKASDFVKSFISSIKELDASLEKMIDLFTSYDSKVITRRENDSEIAIWFEDDSIDPYVYFLEENDFGLEYHRYTKKAYEEAINNHNH